VPQPPGWISSSGSKAVLKGSELKYPASQFSPSRGASKAVAVADSATSQPHSILGPETRILLDHRVAVSLSLLKHLCYESPSSRRVLTLEGKVVETIAALWHNIFSHQVFTDTSSDTIRGRVNRDNSTARKAKSGSTLAASPGLRELLGFLTNLVVECPEAKLEIASGSLEKREEEGATCLLLGLVRMLWNVGNCMVICWAEGVV
jgi:hypothetical protein